jgi:hypothetical protein
MHSHLEQAIKERAHAIWEQDGCPDGKALDHWLRAETEIISSSLYSIPRTSYENFGGLSRCPREPHMMYSGVAASHRRRARGGAQWQGHDL